MKAGFSAVAMGVVLLLGTILAGLVSGRSLAGPPTCRGNEDLVGAIAALPHVAPVLTVGGTLHVLGIGSATMFGPEASLQPGTITSLSVANGAAPKPAPVPALTEPSERAFPRQMAAVLEELVPGLTVDIAIRGGRGMTAAEMLDLLKHELASGHYQLVLWQTGTVEAVKNIPPSEFAQTLADGAEATAAAGANLILIDPQYSRFLQTNSNLDPYVQALQQAASMPGVMLFHRFELMRAWANDGQLDLERTPKPDRKRAVDTLHACLGRSLARMVLAGARA